MPEWDELMRSKFFITDLGVEKSVLISGVQMTMGRYAVWSPTKDDCRHAIVEVSSDLDALKKKYAVSEERICRVLHNEKEAV